LKKVSNRRLCGKKEKLFGRGQIMKNINEKIDKYLKEANVEDYDISEETTQFL